MKIFSATGKKGVTCQMLESSAGGRLEQDLFLLLTLPAMGKEDEPLRSSPGCPQLSRLSMAAL